jgi:hypothetical protein
VRRRLGRAAPPGPLPEAVEAVCARVPRLAARRATLVATRLSRARAGGAKADQAAVRAWRDAIARHQAIGAHGEALRLTVAQHAGRPLDDAARRHLATLEREALRQRRFDVVVDAALLRLRDALRRTPGASATVDAAARLAELAARHGRTRQHAEALDGWLAAAMAAREPRLMGRLVVALTHKHDAWPPRLRAALLLRAAEACLELERADDARRWLRAAAEAADGWRGAAAARRAGPGGLLRARAERLSLGLLAAQGRHAEVDARASALLDPGASPLGADADGHSGAAGALIGRAWCDLVLARGDADALANVEQTARKVGLDLFPRGERSALLRAAHAALLRGAPERTLAILDELEEPAALKGPAEPAEPAEPAKPAKPDELGAAGQAADVPATALRVSALAALHRDAEAAERYLALAKRAVALPSAAHVCGAQALGRTGRLDQAAHAAERGLQRARDRGTPRELGAALLAAGQVAVARGDVDRGGRLLGEALGVTALAGAPEHAQVQAVVARLLAVGPGSP